MILETTLIKRYVSELVQWRWSILPCLAGWGYNPELIDPLLLVEDLLAWLNVRYSLATIKGLTATELGKRQLVKEIKKQLPGTCMNGILLQLPPRLKRS